MAKKQLSTEEITQIASDLQNSKSEKRRSAAKKIGKNQLGELGDELYNAYIKEREDKRTWETQTEMILAFGKIGYKKALPDIKTIIDKNEPHDMITIAAARSYVRLNRKDLRDVEPVIDLLQFGNLSVLNGATAILTFDDMSTSEENAKTIISIMDSKKEEDIAIRGLGDPRENLISAMSKWKNPTSETYIKRFLDSPNRSLRMCAESAIIGKKTRYE
jgi:HEAT repeat protein